MTFDDAYEKYFKHLYKLSFYRNGGDKYWAEEVTKKTLDVMYEKWDKVSLYEPKQLSSWLYGVLENKLKEMKRQQPQYIESLDEDWCRDLVEHQQYMHGTPIDEEIEYQRFLQYAAQIEHTLHTKDRELFHYRVIDQYPHKVIAKKMNLSENAVKLRWRRLQARIQPFVEKMIGCK